MNKYLLPLLLLIFFSSFGFSQSGEDLLRSYFKERVALKNSILVNGIEPVDSKIIKNESGKYLKNEFELGTITYNDHLFQNIRLKYNVYDDYVLANISQGDGEKFFQLIKERLRSFSIGDKKFDFLEYKPKIFGYLEVVFHEHSIKLYKRYLKEELEKIDKNYVYYEYAFKDSEFYLEFNSNVFALKNQQDLIAIWPTQKKLIRNYYKKNRALKNTDKFYTQILLLIKNSES